MTEFRSEMICTTEVERMYIFLKKTVDFPLFFVSIAMRLHPAFATRRWPLKVAKSIASELFRYGLMSLAIVRESIVACELIIEIMEKYYDNKQNYLVMN